MVDFGGVLCLLVVVAILFVPIFALAGRDKRRRCPRCSRRMSYSVCLDCRWPSSANASAAEVALRSVRNHVTDLEQAGMLPRDAVDRIRSALQEESALLAVPAPRAAAESVVDFRAAREAVSPGDARDETAAAAIPTLAAADRQAEENRTDMPPPPPVPADRGERSTDDALRGEEAEPSGRLPPPPPPLAAPPDHARLADLLATFMEERNVRWGELVGGLLIVGCSIALVISFWAQIAARPLLKFSLFNGIVAVLYALGFYTGRKWKLPTTSRGVLVTSTMLVPLNFLSIAAVTRDEVADSPLIIVGEVISVMIFSALVYLAGRSITTPAPAALTVGVLGSSIAQLFVRRWAHTDMQTLQLYALCGFPLLCYGSAVGVILARSRRLAELTESEINAQFRMLGLAAFAAIPPCGMLLNLTGDASGTIERLAPLVALAGAPALASGLLLWRRLADTPLTGLRTAGTAVALLGMGFILGGVALAWPQPALLVSVAALDLAVVTLVAIAYDIPPAHLVAGAAGGLGFVITFQVAMGNLSWSADSPAETWQAILSASSGNGLAGLAAVYLALAAVWSYYGRRLHALWYGVVAAATAVASLALVTLFSFRVEGDPFGATWIYGIYAVVALAASEMLGRAKSSLPLRLAKLPTQLAWAGSSLVALSIVQGLVYRPVPPGGLVAPWTTAAILHAAVMLVIVIGLRLRRPTRSRVHGALQQTALLSSVVALALIVADTFGWIMPPIAPLVCAQHGLLLALIWFTAAYLRTSSVLFTAGQAMIFGAAALWAVDLASHQAWYASTPLVAIDPRMLHWLGCLWGTVCLGWMAARIFVERNSLQQLTADMSPGFAWLRTSQKFLRPAWPAVDHLATAVVLVVLVALASYAALPGVAQELSPRTSVLELQRQAPQLVRQVNERRLVPATLAFEPWGVPHEPAQEGGTWLLLGLLAVLFVAVAWESANNGWRLLGGLVLTATLCPLLASRWEAQVSVASALRWLSGGYFLVGSIGFWSRDWLVAWGRRLNWRQVQGPPPTLPLQSIAWLAILAAAPLTAMAGYVAVEALRHAAFDPWFAQLATRTGIVCALATVGALWLISYARRGFRQRQGEPPRWAALLGSLGTLLLVVGIAPLLVISSYAIAAALVGNPVVGPDPASIFARMGLAANYSLPAALVSLVLVGYAIRERSPAFAFVAGLVTNLSATLAYLFTIGGKLAVRDPSLWTDLGQLNALVAAAFGLAWHGAITWSARRARREQPTIDSLQAVQAGLALVLNCVVLGTSSLALLSTPLTPPAWLPHVAGPLGIAATVGALLLALILSRRRAGLVTIALVAVSLWSVGTVAGAGAVRWDAFNSLAIHVMLAARMCAPWALLGGVWLWNRRKPFSLDDPRRRTTTLWTSILAVPVMVVGLRSMDPLDPQEPWWSTAAVFSAALVAVALALWSYRRRFVYVAASLLVAAASIWYPRSAFWAALASGDEHAMGFVYTNLVAIALPVVAWLLIELRWIRPLEAQLHRWWHLPAHRPATWLSLTVLVLATGMGVIADFAGWHPATTSLLGYAALGAIGAATWSCLWDARARESVVLLYLFGLVLVGKYLDRLDLEGDRLLWAGIISLGAFNLAASYLWSRRAGARSLAQRLGIPLPKDVGGDSTVGIVSLTAILVAVVLALVFWVELVCPDQTLRVTAGQAAIAQAFSLAMLARQERRKRLQRDALLVGALGMVALTWSWINPDDEYPFLNRSVATCVALVVTTIVYGLGFSKLPARWGDWPQAAQRLTPAAVVVLALSVVTVLGQEFVYFVDYDDVPLAWPEIVAVALALGSLFAAALAAALLPGRDPLGLSERRRMAYVYAAECVLALLFLHVRMTMPWLFSGVFLAYWPLIVMGVAYLGVGLAEWFGRRRQRILAEPIERTGVLLPLLPVLGFWFMPSQTNYSVIMLIVSGLYAALAVTRKSTGFGLLAALAANGGLWHYLHRLGGFGIAEHPQLWLIPPALCVLVAVYLNRDRLTVAQMTTIRYITSMTIYLSSTADIFLNGVAQAPWLPLVLGALAIGGVFAGIALRVRAFLFLGVSFLVLAIVTIIWHAAVDLDQTWIWYASGIVVGVAIVVLFAVFEKKRQDVLNLLGQLKHWEAR